ncbi:MAG: hypothetical protein F6K19_44845 [Cyanothece sp. SIO1E1]|nr:hypothetical protein [Cyanothece sp. SIO1E1]
MHELGDDLAVDVLVGAITISSGSSPAQVINASKQYLYSSENGNSSVINDIDPITIAESPPVQNFLDPDNWPSDLAELLEKYRSAIFGEIALTKEQKAILALHNQCREDVGVAPLRWSHEIAAYAQDWADQLAATNSFEHRSGSRYGENLAGGSPTEKVVKQWCREKRKYNPNTSNSKFRM